jgi:hypothetical protein
MATDHFKLNVGGVRLEASLATLTKVPESMLATMFGARLDMLRRDPEDGSVFLDRDGDCFRLVLDFLRGDASEAAKVAKTIREMPAPLHEAMMHELDFFGLTDAVFPVVPIEDGKFKAWGELNSTRRGCAAVIHGPRKMSMTSMLPEAPRCSVDKIYMLLLCTLYIDKATKP